jgi:hypothetical protein
MAPAEPATSLYTIASPGGSGTKWYSRLFTTGRSYCFHELTTILRRSPVNVVELERLAEQSRSHDFEQAGRRFVLEGFPQYFDRLFELGGRGYDAIGNSDGNATPMLAGLWLLWPRMRFLFSFRDGIGQVNSFSVWENEMKPSMLAVMQTRHGAMEYFELLCHDWNWNVERLELSRDWLRERDAAVTETRFEAMLSDPGELQRVWSELIGDWEAARHRATRFAETIVGGRAGREHPQTAGEIWETWTPAQRGVFERVCGETQRRLGYLLPA